MPIVYSVKALSAEAHYCSWHSWCTIISIDRSMLVWSFTRTNVLVDKMSARPTHVHVYTLVALLSVSLATSMHFGVVIRVVVGSRRHTQAPQAFPHLWCCVPGIMPGTINIKYVAVCQIQLKSSRSSYMLTVPRMHSLWYTWYVLQYNGHQGIYLFTRFTFPSETCAYTHWYT